MSRQSWKPDTAAIHGGLEPSENRGAVSVPIYQTSTFAFPSAEEGASRFAGASSGFIYTRLGNPTVQALEECVAALERGTGAVATATGMAAITTTLLSLLRHGDHLLATEPVYGSTRKLLLNYLGPKFGITTTFVPASNAAALRSELRPETRLIFVETPANPTLDLVDIEAAAMVANSAGILLVVDNTFAGPWLQRPLEQGAGLVVESMTKSLAGHSDVIAGAVIAREESLLRMVRQTAGVLGTTIDPHQAWLVLRGIRTLGMRVERAQANAMDLAGWLSRHAAVAWVRYPGLPSHPQYQIAKRQMLGPGSIIAFELRGGSRAGRLLMNNLRLITLAVSLGGVESLIEHPASMTHAALSEEERRAEGITPGLVRLAVGCENVDDLRADLKEALATVEANTRAAVLAGTGG